VMRVASGSALVGVGAVMAGRGTVSVGVSWGAATDGAAAAPRVRVAAFAVDFLAVVFFAAVFAVAVFAAAFAVAALAVGFLAAGAFAVGFFAVDFFAAAVDGFAAAVGAFAVDFLAVVLGAGLAALFAVDFFAVLLRPRPALKANRSGSGSDDPPVPLDPRPPDFDDDPREEDPVLPDPRLDALVVPSSSMRAPYRPSPQTNVRGMLPGRGASCPGGISKSAGSEDTGSGPMAIWEHIRPVGIDLHCHTIFSDGTFTPRASVALAKDRGVDTLAITDHDTTAGLPEAFEAGSELGVELVPGVEFSTVFDGEGVHVLCYYMDLDDPELAAELQRLRDDRFTRGERMVARLQDLGYPITFERVREIAHGGNVIRPHVAQALVEAGVVPTAKDAFTDELIGSGGRAYVEKHALHPLDALTLIHRAGGVCVLAHPGTFRETKPVPATLIEELAAAGLDGLEASHPEHTPEVEARYIEMADRLGLFWTGSSDCHGDRYVPVRLGMRSTPPEQFDRLKARAAELRLSASR
jgi:3',5'-nucleoside bisphosphate phosphatase